MISQEEEKYRNLKIRRGLYKVATKQGNSIRRLGVILLLSSAFFILPLILERIFGLNPALSFFIGMPLGFLLINIGDKINNRVPISDLSFTEEAFLNVFESMKCIEGGYSNEAVKRLSKFEKQIFIPTSGYQFDELTKEANVNIGRLKQNIKERLVPNVAQIGDKGDIKKVHTILEKLAKYLLLFLSSETKPTVSELKELNESMAELPEIEKATSPAKPPFFVRYPNLRLPSIITIFGFLAFVLSYLSSYLSVKFFDAQHDAALQFGATIFGAIFGTLSIVYVTIVRRK